MRCEEAHSLIGGLIDGELQDDARRALMAHLDGCAACAARVAAERRQGRAVAGLAEAAPAGLAGRVRAALAAEAEPRHRSSLRGVPVALAAAIRGRPLGAVLLSAAASALLAVALTWWVLAGAGQAGSVEREVLAAHIRSLLQDGAIQVASADSHTVKPWFAGRLDVAPSVRDLSDEGFPLLGGRLDYLLDRRVGAVVYRRRQHLINVFMWPDPDWAGGDAAPVSSVRNGYSLVRWRRNGIVHWAVSDLNPGELRHLAALL